LEWRELHIGAPHTYITLS